MAEGGYLLEVVLILFAAVIAIGISQRLRLGSVLGYLVAGAIIGPFGFGLVREDETVHALAELGVVFLLFTVGLELPFERIRVSFGRVFGLGVLQILVTGLILGLIVHSFGYVLSVSIVIGLSLALSSTAIVLRLLSDKQTLTTGYGRTAFGILLVQDLAVGPLLVVVLALNFGELGVFEALGLSLVKLAAVVLAILGLGRIILRHVFFQVANLREPEIFAALTLFVVLVSSLLTKLAGLSMALGAFLAGMLLAETNYRHQVAAEILPFRALLLGLFFMTVGMSVDIALTINQPLTVLAVVVGLIVIKASILTLLAKAFGLPWGQAIALGPLLSQGGEFAFVLLGAAVVSGLLSRGDVEVIVVAVALTMMLTPLLARLGLALEARVDRRQAKRVEEIPEQTEELKDHVVIVGFGRVGSTIANSLSAADVAYIAVDLDPHRINQAQQRNLPVYFGDASRPEILATLHVERARSVVIAIDDARAALHLVSFLRYIFPDLKIFVRARDEQHAADLKQAGAHIVVPELVATGVRLAGSILAED